MKTKQSIKEYNENLGRPYLINQSDLYELADKYITDANFRIIDPNKKLYCIACSIMDYNATTREQNYFASHYNYLLMS